MANSADLDQFRAETKAWLEENCPASMRTSTPEEEVVWGGRKQEWVNPDSKVWMETLLINLPYHNARS